MKEKLIVIFAGICMIFSVFMYACDTGNSDDGANEDPRIYTPVQGGNLVSFTRTFNDSPVSLLDCYSQHCNSSSKYYGRTKTSCIDWYRLSLKFDVCDYNFNECINTLSQDKTYCDSMKYGCYTDVEEEVAEQTTKYDYLYEQYDTCNAGTGGGGSQYPGSGIYVYNCYYKDKEEIEEEIDPGSVLNIGTVGKPGESKKLLLKIRNFNDTAFILTNIIISNKNDFRFLTDLADANGDWHLAGRPLSIQPTQFVSGQECGGMDFIIYFAPQFGGPKQTYINIEGDFPFVFKITGSTRCDPRPCVSNTCVPCSLNKCP